MQVQIGVAFGEISKPGFTLAAISGIAVLIITSQLVRGVLQFMRNFSADLAGQRLERDMRDELYASLIGKSMSFHDRQRIGDVLARASNDVREVNLMMSPGVNIVLGSGGFLLMPLIAAPQIHPQLILVLLGFLGAYFFLVRDYLTRLAPATDAVRRDFGKMNMALSESIDGSRRSRPRPRSCARRHALKQGWLPGSAPRCARDTPNRASCPCCYSASPTRSGCGTACRCIRPGRSTSAAWCRSTRC